jgi:hypothetical protein
VITFATKGGAASGAAMHADRLAEADRQVRETEGFIEHQRRVIGELKAHGRNTSDAEATLGLLLRSVEVFKRRRQRILDDTAKG